MKGVESSEKIDTSEHISDRLHKTAQLMRKPKYSGNNSQSDFSDNIAFTLFSVKLSDQIENPQHRYTTCIQYHNQPKIHPVEKNKGQIDRIMFTRNQ